MSERRMTFRQDRQLKKAFLERFREHGNISRAVRETGVPYRDKVYIWQEHDDEFAAAFQEAEVIATEVLEEAAHRRAVEGVAREKPIYQMSTGKLLDTVTEIEYSDTLLIFLLKARAPHKYRDQLDVNLILHREAERLAEQYDRPLPEVLAEVKDRARKVLAP